MTLCSSRDHYRYTINPLNSSLCCASQTRLPRRSLLPSTVKKRRHFIPSFLVHHGMTWRMHSRMDLANLYRKILYMTHLAHLNVHCLTASSTPKIRPSHAQ